MQTGNEQNNKVVSITDRNRNQQKTEGESSSQGSPVEVKEDFSWNDVMKRNADNASRMKREREKANKGVIRSYRLKH
jgi:hypothetical protein